MIACTDFSEHALPAIESAAALAAASASPFHVLHALEPSVLGLLDIEDRDAADERSWLRARRDAAEHRLAAVAHAVDPRAETAVVEGLVVTALVDAARARRARLMAVGTSGRTGSRRVLLGSVAEELVRATPCSTLFVRLDRRKN